MTNSQRLSQVRESLHHWLQSQAEPETISKEFLLMIDGFYAGRRFEAGKFFAVWFMEEHELKIHAADGELLEVVAGDELQIPADTESSGVIPMSDRDNDEFRRAA